MTPLPEVMTAIEVADAFRVDISTVRRWAASGRLKAIPSPGKHLRFRREDVLQRLGQSTEAAAS